MFAEASQQVSPSVRMSVLKTWTNSWFTSMRLHESVALPCILGCGGEDTLMHYLTCDYFWTLLHSAVGATVEQLTSSPAERACISHISPFSLKRCAVAFSAYHGLKVGNRLAVDKAVAGNEFDDVQESFLVLCKHHAREVGMKKQGLS